MTNVNSRVRGLAAAVILVAFVVGVPTVLVAIHAIPDPSAFSWTRLTAQDDGTLAMQVIAIACWIAWAVFTGQLVVSIVSRVRGIRAPRLPGLAVPQIAADRLVAAAALLFVAVPTISAALPQPRVEAAISAPLPEAPAVADSVAAPTAVVPISVEQKAQPETERYTVKRSDSLWKIAEEQLGDGRRYVELVTLNEAVLDGRPDFLLPGTVLKIPVAEATPEGEYVVRPGDTLSEIAEDRLDDAYAYPSIFEASRDTVQANGAHLTDPDLILPGWKLTIPGDSRPAEPDEPKHVAPQEQAPETAPPTITPSPEPDEEQAGQDQDVAADDARDVVPDWLLPGLAGAGAVFGGCLWLALRHRRRSQLRFRRPGTILPSPPESVLPAEKTAYVTASAIAPRIEALDGALRSLDPSPRVVTVTLSDRQILLALGQAADLPAPWTGSARDWQISLADAPPPPEDSFPPFPLLVSVGRNDAGAFVFLNLEELRTISVTGAAQRTTAFARHLAAELAVNPWSVVTTVDVLGLGADLAEFNLGRIRTHPAGDTGFISQLTRELSSAHATVDPDDFRAAIIASPDRSEEDLAELRNVIEGLAGRSPAVLIDLAGTDEGSLVNMELTGDGRLCVAGLGLDVIAAGLSEDEARACALLLDLTLETEVIAVPTNPADPVSDLAGALHEGLIDKRPYGPAGEASLLPLDAKVYADAAATTVEDVAAIAPVATSDARVEVSVADPDLDDDLARWESPTVSSTKLTLLGPVNARTSGNTKATAHRRPFYIELLAYLTLHPTGAPSSELASTFGLRIERVRVDMSALRRWLGNDPRTGDLYLPNAEAPPDSGEPARYVLNGVLCDLDLFRRLRTRGQSRGADGIDDLIAALRLVSGEPFTDLREDHWAWLLEGDRWDHIMTSAIVDVGHIVTTHALADGDPDLALWAANVAYTAAPYDEVAQLDMIAAEKAAGRSNQADADLRDKVLNRRDDDLPPVDLPERTEQIVRHQKWQPPRSRRTG